MARESVNNYLAIAGNSAIVPYVIDALEITNPRTNLVTYWATDLITYNGRTYTDCLRRVSGLTSVLNGGVSRVSVIATNADLNITSSLSVNARAYIGFPVTLRKIVITDNASADLTMMTGVIVAYRVDESAIELDIVTKTDRLTLLSNRTVSTKCPWIFKGPECGYSGALSTCNKLYNDAGGCSGRSNQHRFGGFPVRPDNATIGAISGLGGAPAYQLVQNDTIVSLQRPTLKFDETFLIEDNPTSSTTSITAITPDWLNPQSLTFKAAGVATTTTGSITTGTALLTVASVANWRVGHGIRITGAGSAGEVLNTTIIAINGNVFTLNHNASTTVSSATVSHTDTAALQTALSAASNNDKPIYLPAGVYYAEDLLLNSPNSLHIMGAGPGCTILRSRGNNPVLRIDTTTATAHSITIENLSFEGSGPGDAPALPSPYVNNYGFWLSDTGGQGIFNITLRNCRFNNCGNSAIKTTSGGNGTFTVLLEGVDVSQPSNAVGHAIDIYGSNDIAFVRCYVHEVASQKAAYRVRAGAPVFISCNGIDAGSEATWGLFGQSFAEDGVDSYARVTLIGCNIETYTKYGVRCKTGSFASFFNCRFIAPTAEATKPTKVVTPIQFDFLNENQIGILDSMTTFDILPGLDKDGQPIGAGYVHDQAIHSRGMPFLMLGSNAHPTFYDLAGEAVASLPSLTGSRITGSQDFAFTWNGYQKMMGPIAFIEQADAPYTVPGNTGFLYAKEVGTPANTTGLYWKAQGVAEKRIDTIPEKPIFLTDTRVAFGDSSNVLSESANLTFNNGSKILTISGTTNPYLFVRDTANAIDLRVGTLSGAPDRGIIGTSTNHAFVLYQNANEAWGVTTDRHWVPFAGDKLLDIGSSSVYVRDIYLGRQVHSAGSVLTYTTGAGAGTSPTVILEGNAIAGNIKLTTGTTPAHSAMILEFTMPVAFSTQSVIQLTPANSATAELNHTMAVYVDHAAKTTTKWSIKSGSKELDASTAYIWYYHIIGI